MNPQPIMDSEKAAELLEMLLEAEMTGGRPPGTVPPGIFDGPRSVACLLDRLRRGSGAGGEISTRDLVSSISGGYLGRGELLWQHGFDRVLPASFADELRGALDGWLAQKS